MILIKRIADLNILITTLKTTGHTIGFVPTMGALHQGHISLIKYSNNACTTTICSIFVNPTQFNDPKDFDKYPVTIENDLNVLEINKCDIVFMPSVAEMYPNGFSHLPDYDLGYLETVLEGKYRPGHFQGVCQVVHRLLEIVQPDLLYLGQKDYQQCMVIKKLIELTGIKTQLSICPTLRENDGLAMSSRNMRLNDAERQKAVRLSEILQFIKKEIYIGYTKDLTERARLYLSAEGFKVDYVAIADAETLALVENWDGSLKIVALVAAYLNEVRLIDNMLIN
jgi:pantoate--beta-alanine ligase